MIAIYTGARRNEIAGLLPDDVKQDKTTGIWYFDITDEVEEGKSLKTEAAKRIVPVHPRLIEKGFLAFVEQSRSVERKKGELAPRLLHHLTYTEHEKWGRNLGRWFNESYLKGIGLKTDRKSLHSLRHSFITYLSASGVDGAIIKSLVGHESDSVTAATYLPSVKNIDRHATNMSLDAYHSINEIYKNLISNVSLSEVYIVPSTLNPDALDPVTKKPEAPNIMFDGTEHPPGTEEQEEKNDPNALAEEESYEYHLQQQQMAWFKEHYPKADAIQGNALPMIGGPTVITCDNTDYTKTHDDKDRQGLVLAVPYYAPDGAFKGEIAAVIRSNVIRDLLPRNNFALVNTSYGYVQSGREGGQTNDSREYVASASPDPRLVYSEVLSVKTADPRSIWQVWAGYPNERFYSSPEMLSLRSFKYIGYGLCVAFIIAVSFIWGFIRRNYRMIERNNQDLERKVSERTARVEALAKEQELQKQIAEEEKKKAMRALADRFQSEVGSTIGDVITAAADLQKTAKGMAGSADETSRQSSSVASASEEATTNVQTVASATEELSASVREIRQRVEQSNNMVQQASQQVTLTNRKVQGLTEAANKIGAVVDLITDVAAQTNLLALNATIEAARAGEAGKGFAVVASEVKNLAAQTTKATEEITQQIKSIQEETAASAEAIFNITRAIEDVSQTSAAIAAAVEQQEAATREIARNVSEAAQGTGSVSSSILSVSETARKTGAAAGDVLAASVKLSQNGEELRKQVESFLQKVRTA